MTIAILSLWRNDQQRQLEDRAAHLLSKTAGDHQIRWVWIVGDSTDETAARLMGMALRHPDKDIITVLHDTGIEGEDHETRRRRGSATATVLFSHLAEGDTFACLHESDLRSSADILEALLRTPLCVEPNTLENGAIAGVAGWPTIHLDPRRPPQFYDIWAYRDLRGRLFSARPPHARGWHRNGAPFQVSSFGSVWMVPGALLRNRSIERLAVVELCAQWKKEGVDLWAAPEIPIEQPTELWP